MGVNVGVVGRGVLVGVTVGAGVDVGMYGVPVGDAGGLVAVGATVGVGVLVIVAGGGVEEGVGVGVGVGVDLVTKRLAPNPPPAMQAIKVAPANARLVAAAQSGGVDT